MTTYDDDYAQFETDGPGASPTVRVVKLVDLGLHWPPPEKIFYDGDVWVRRSHSQIGDDERAGMTHVARGSAYERQVADPDRPCEHPDFHVHASVNRLTEVDGGPVIAFQACVMIRCTACGERFRWLGCPPGNLPDRPTVSVDAYELRAPVRPGSADEDFGMGIPGFIMTMRPPEPL